MTDILQTISNITFLLLLAAGAIGGLWFAIGGLLYQMSTGNPQRAETAKDTMKNAVIGGVLVMLGFGIITLVLNAVTGSLVSTPSIPDPIPPTGF